MGAAVSSNVAKTTANVVSSVINTQIQNELAQSDSSQIISVSNVEGNVTIDGNVSKVEVTIDMEQLLNTFTDANVQQDLALKLAQAAKALVKDINLGNVSVALNKVENFITETINVTTTLNQSCASNVTSTQKIIVDSVQGNVNINDNQFVAILDLVQNCVLKAVSNTTSVNDLQTEINQSSTSKTFGISIWGIGFVLLIILGGAFLILLGPELIPIIAIGKNPKIFGIIIFTIGLIFLAIWEFWYESSISSSLWARSFDSECKPVEVLSKHNVSSADEASRLCANDKNAIAYDFVANKKTGNYWVKLTQFEAVLYSKVGSGCTLLTDDSPILTTREVTISNENAPERFAKVFNGEIWINTSTATIQEYKDGTWTVPKVIDKRIDSVSVDIEGATLLSKNPNSNFKLKSTRDLVSFTITNISTNEIFSIPGPGLTLIENLVPNVSGIKIKKRKNWALYTGAGLAIVGILVAVFTKPKQPKQSKSTINAKK